MLSMPNYTNSKRGDRVQRNKFPLIAPHESCSHTSKTVSIGQFVERMVMTSIKGVWKMKSQPSKQTPIAMHTHTLRIGHSNGKNKTRIMKIYKNSNAFFNAKKLYLISSTNSCLFSRSRGFFLRIFVLWLSENTFVWDERNKIGYRLSTKYAL